MAKFRIEHRYPCYAGGCMPHHGYFVQVLKEGFPNKWVDVVGFAKKEKAEKLKELLEK